jgi:hypothetical protein
VDMVAAAWTECTKPVVSGQWSVKIEAPLLRAGLFLLRINLETRTQLPKQGAYVVGEGRAVGTFPRGELEVS